MKKLVSLILAVTAGLFLASCQGQNNIFTYTIDESYTEYITLGTSADYPPYEWPMKVSGKQTLVGIDIEIAKEVAKALGKNLKVVNKGFEFLLDDLENGKVDFVLAGMNPSEERKKQVDFSIIYYEANQVILVNESEKDSFASLESLNVASLRIGAQIGSVQQTLVEEHFNKAQTQFIQSVPDLVLRLSNKQLNAVVVERPVAEGYLKNISGLHILDLQIGNPEEGSAAAVQKGNTELLAVINQILESLISSGKMDQIIFDMTELNKN